MIHQIAFRVGRRGAVLALASVLGACADDPDPVLQSNFLPVWTVDVGGPLLSPYPPNVALRDGSLSFAFGSGFDPTGTIGRFDATSADLQWSVGGVPYLADCATAVNGRMHCVANREIRRFEPTGTALSPLSIEWPRVIAVRGNDMYVAQYSGLTIPIVAHLSAAGTVEWTQQFAGDGRCRFPQVLRASIDRVFIAGNESPVDGQGNCNGFNRGDVWFAAISPEDGHTLWSQTFDDGSDDSLLIDDAVISAEGVTYVSGSFGVKALASDGTELWSHPPEPYSTPRSLAVLSSTQLAVLLPTGTDGRLTVFDRFSGVREPDSAFVNVAGAHGRIDMTADGLLALAGYRGTSPYQPYVAVFQWAEEP